MTPTTMITSRRFSPSLRLKLQVVFAKAWEALAETYRVQAGEFVRRVTPSLPVDEALDRFFRDVGVPAGMAETVRARALIALAPMIDHLALESSEGVPSDAAGAESSAWRVLRLDHLVGSLRQRVQYVEETNLQCRLAACVADEAIAATHVRMALEIADALDGELPPDEAIMHYVRTLNLPALEAQIIFQRAMASWADRHVPGLDAALPSLDVAAACASGPKLELVPVPALAMRLRATV